MPIHANITPQSDGELLARAIRGVSRTAAYQQTGNSGTAYYANGDGTGVVIGQGAAEQGGIGRLQADGSITPLVDTAAIDAKIAQARKDLAAAEQDLADNKKTLAAAQSDIAANKTAIADVSSTVSSGLKSAQVAADRAAQDAATAGTTAKNAQTAAKNAQTSADKAENSVQANTSRISGRTKVFVQQIAPAGSTADPLKNGDIWYQTDTSKHVVGVNTFNGTGWEPYTVEAGQVLVPGSVGTVSIADGSVTTPKLVAAAVTADKIAAGSVNAAKLAANAVTAGKIAAGSVGADQLAANAVTAGKIQAGAVGTDQLAANSVTSDKLTANSVTAGKLAADSVTAANIAANAITADKIAGNKLIGTTIQTDTDDRPHMALLGHNSYSDLSVPTSNGVLEFLGRDENSSNPVPTYVGGLEFSQQKNPSAQGADIGDMCISTWQVNTPDDQKSNFISLSDDFNSYARNRLLNMVSQQVYIQTDPVNESKDEQFTEFSFTGQHLTRSEMTSGRQTIAAWHAMLYHRTDAAAQRANMRVDMSSTINLDDWDFLDIEYVSNSQQVHSTMRIYKPANGTWVGYKFVLSMNYFGMNQTMWFNSDMMHVVNVHTIDCIENGNTWLRGQYSSGARNGTYKDAMWITRIEGWRD